MNNSSFAKMLKFELKANSMIWIIGLLVSSSLIFISTTIHYPNGINNSALKLVYLLICAFTLFSYQESTKRQSMQMYHLLPISKNVKFFTKLFLTLFLFPTFLILAYFILFFLFRPVNIEQNLGTWSNSQILLQWISKLAFGHAICTFCAIGFKKNKLINTVVALIIIIFIISIPLNILSSLFHLGRITASNFLLSDYMSNEWIIILRFMLSIIIYGLSYFSFLGREL